MHSTLRALFLTVAVAGAVTMLPVPAAQANATERPPPLCGLTEHLGVNLALGAKC